MTFAEAKVGTRVVRPPSPVVGVLLGYRWTPNSPYYWVMWLSDPGALPLPDPTQDNTEEVHIGELRVVAEP